MNGKKMGMIGFVVIAAILAMSTAAATTVYMDVPTCVQNGSQFTVSVVVDNVTDMNGFGFNLTFNSSVIQFVKAEKGNDIQDWDIFSNITVSNDEIRIVAAGLDFQTQQQLPKSGPNLEIAKITFNAVKAETSPLNFSKASMVDSNANQIPATFQNATVSVQAVCGPEIQNFNVENTQYGANIVVASSEAELAFRGTVINQDVNTITISLPPGFEYIKNSTQVTVANEDITSYLNVTVQGETVQNITLTSKAGGPVVAAGKTFEIKAGVIPPSEAGSYTGYVKVNPTYPYMVWAVKVVDISKDVYFPSSTTGLNHNFKFKSVDVIYGGSALPHYLVYNWVEGRTISVEISPWTSDSSWEVFIDGSSKGTGKDNVATFEIPDPGSHTVTICVYEPNKSPDCLNINPAGNAIDDKSRTFVNMIVYKTKVATLPEISISPTGVPVVLGDSAYFKVSVSQLPAGGWARWVILGPAETRIVGGVIGPATTPGGSVSDVVQFDTDRYVKTPTLLHPGQYKFVVIAYDATGRQLTLDAVKFEVLDLDYTLVSPTTAKVGTKVPVYGTVNAADTGDISDTSVQNKVTISIRDPTGAVIYGPVTVPIKDGQFWIPPKVLTLGPNFVTGSYRVDVTVTVSTNVKDSDTFYFTVTEPSVEFTLAKNTFTRSESIYIEGKTDISEWNTGAIFVYVREDPALTTLFDPADIASYNGYVITVPGSAIGEPQPSYTGIVIPISADGTFKSLKLHINSNAPRQTYTLVGIVGYYPSGTPGVGAFAFPANVFKDVTTIRVVKNTLNATISPKIVTRGDEVKLRVDNVALGGVYVFTDRPNILNNVPQIPRDDSPFSLNPAGLYAISAKDGVAETVLTVSRNTQNVRPDTYLIYILETPDWGDANGNGGIDFDPTQNAMAIVSLTVQEFAFESVPATIDMVQADSVDVFVKVNGDPDYVQAYMEIKGHGVNVPYTNMPMSKYNESGSGWLFATIYPFYNKQTYSLSSNFIDLATTEPLKVGSYVVKFYLYDGWSRSQVDEKTAILKVEPMKFVSIEPWGTSDTYTVTAGENLVVNIETNRKSAQYDDVHVILDLGSKRLKFLNIPLVDGKGSVTLPTSGIAPGEYKVYIRDRMKTSTADWDWDKHYDYDPTKEYYAAKDVLGQDDALVVKTLEIVKAAPTATTTATVTTTATTTATVTTTATTTATAAATTTAVTTTTPAEGGGIPGFEAVFAIAGLLAVAYLLRRR